MAGHATGTRIQTEHVPSLTTTATTATAAKTTTTTTATRRWLVVVTGVWIILHVQQQQVLANVSFASGMVRLNKTRLDEINKRAWLNRLSKMLAVAEVNVTQQHDADAAAGGEGGGPGMGSPSSSLLSPGSGRRGDGAVGSALKNYNPSSSTTSLPPVFVFSKSRGKNILQFELKPSTSGTMTASVAKVNLYVYVWKRRETRRSRRNRRKSKKSKLIKIRVFLVDDRNRKKKRIAELRKRVHSSNWHRLSLPVSLIHSLWQAHNGTLNVRVKCKWCSRKVQLIMPADVAKCHKKKKRRRMRLNAGRHRGALGGGSGGSSPSPRSSRRGQRRAGLRSLDADTKCSSVGRGVPGLVPFMVIEKRIGSLPAAAVRNRRSALSSSSSSSSSSRPGSSSSSSSSPSSSSSSSSSRVCDRSSRHSDCCVLATPVDLSEYGMGDSIVAPSTLMATTCDGTCTQLHHHRRRRRMRVNSRRGSRRRKGRGEPTCEPVQSQPLDVWFFDHNHELAHASLPGLVISRCGCRRQ